MAITTSTIRSWWSAFRCDPGPTMGLMGFTVRAQAGTHEGYEALASVLTAKGYDPAVVGSHRWCPTGISGRDCQPDGTSCSLHNYSLALDFDPFGHGNPHFFKRFGNGWDFSDTKFTRAQVEAVEAIRTNNGKQVWRWLGWLIGDTMHFEIHCAPADLATGIDWSTVDGTKQGEDDAMLPLKKGMGFEGQEHKIEDVRALQDMLNHLGAGLKLDGLYGPATVAAAKEIAGGWTGNPDGQKGEWFGGNQYGELILEIAKAHAGGGEKGDKGDPGADGADGADGLPGPPGKDGKDGADGTLIVRGAKEI